MQIEMLLMILLTIRTEMRVITATLVLMKITVSKTIFTTKGTIMMTSMSNQN